MIGPLLTENYHGEICAWQHSSKEEPTIDELVISSQSLNGFVISSPTRNKDVRHVSHVTILSRCSYEL